MFRLQKEGYMAKGMGYQRTAQTLTALFQFKAATMPLIEALAKLIEASSLTISLGLVRKQGTRGQRLLVGFRAETTNDDGSQFIELENFLKDLAIQEFSAAPVVDGTFDRAQLAEALRLAYPVEPGNRSSNNGNTTGDGPKDHVPPSYIGSVIMRYWEFETSGNGQLSMVTIFVHSGVKQLPFMIMQQVHSKLATARIFQDQPRRELAIVYEASIEQLLASLREIFRAMHIDIEVEGVFQSFGEGTAHLMSILREDASTAARPEMLRITKLLMGE